MLKACFYNNRSSNSDNIIIGKINGQSNVFKWKTIKINDKGVYQFCINVIIHLKLQFNKAMSPVKMWFTVILGQLRGAVKHIKKHYL